MRNTREQIAIRDWRVCYVRHVTTPHLLFSRRSDFSAKSPRMPVSVGGPPDEGLDVTWCYIATAAAVALRKCCHFEIHPKQAAGHDGFNCVVEDYNYQSVSQILRGKTRNNKSSLGRAELTLWVLTDLKGVEIKLWIRFSYQGFYFLSILKSVCSLWPQALMIFDHTQLFPD